MKLPGIITSPRAMIFVIFLVNFIFWFIVKRGESEYSSSYASVDCIVPAYNEEVTISKTLSDLLANRYIDTIIVINDGSTDNTLGVLSEFESLYGDRLIVISQPNTGKAGAINNALGYVNSDKVFLTDADMHLST